VPPLSTLPPPSVRYFEDYPVGAVFEFGEARVTEAEILEFARRYDPQDMHTDPEAAAAGEFGGLIASGWHTVGMMMRMFADHYLPKGGLASPGVDELRWSRPVRPGDTLRIRLTVLEAVPSRSKPDRGMIRVWIELLNQHNEVVLSAKPMNMHRRRPA
jgi:acyl dehydratase